MTRRGLTNRESPAERLGIRPLESPRMRDEPIGMWREGGLELALRGALRGPLAIVSFDVSGTYAGARVGTSTAVAPRYAAPQRQRCPTRSEIARANS
jgi:hypothetical protein